MVKENMVNSVAHLIAAGRHRECRRGLKDKV